MHKKPKITFVVLDLVPQGGNRVIIDIANNLLNSGYPTTIYTSRNLDYLPFTILNDVEIKPLINIKNKTVAYLIFPLLIPFLVKGDVIVATFYYIKFPTKLAAWIRNSDFFYFVQGIEDLRSGVIGNLLNMLCSFSLKEKKIIASNKLLADQISKKIGKDVVNINISPSNSFFEFANNPDMRYDIIYFARSENFKRIELFYQLFKCPKFVSRNWKIVLVTQDDLLFDKLTRMRLSGCTIIKPTNDIELINIIDSSKVLFFTSSYEGLGLPPLECMLRGLPVVTYPVDPLNKILKGELSSLIIHDTESAIKKLNYLITNDNTRNELGNLCKTMVQDKFTLKSSDELIHKMKELSAKNEL